MKVCHIVESLGSGIVEFIYQIIINIPNSTHTLIYNQREIDIEIIRLKYPKNVTFIEWEFAQREINIKNDIKACAFLINFLKGKDFDVIHLHSSKAGFLGRIATKYLSLRNVIYTPNGAPFARKDIGLFKKLLFILLEFLAARISGQVICSSQSETNLYRKYAISSDFINNGINPPSGSDFSRKNYDNKTKVICTAGRICYQKNPKLFNSIATSFVDNKNIRFIWIGEGELESELVSKNIEITGWLSKEKVLEYLSNADIYLSTALWEGLPFAVLEAMSLGKPLLLKTCVGNIDLIKKNVNGFLYQTEEEAIELINYYLGNPDILISFGQASKDLFNQEFTAKQMALKYEKVYSGYI